MKRITVDLTEDEFKRVSAMSRRSEMSLKRWTKLAVTSAAYVDEAHWDEMDRRDAIVRELSADRERFAKLSRHLRGLPDTTFDLLVRELVAQREKGRDEGSESALRLAAVRRTEREA